MFIIEFDPTLNKDYLILSYIDIKYCKIRYVNIQQEGNIGL